MPPFPQPTALQMEQQARFEVEAFKMGVERFREAIATRDLSELTAGQRLLREIVPKFAALLCKAKDEALELINNGASSHPPPWAWPIGLLADGCGLAPLPFLPKSHSIIINSYD